jgi:hypothetical protein
MYYGVMISLTETDQPGSVGPRCSFCHSTCAHEASSSAAHEYVAICWVLSRRILPIMLHNSVFYLYFAAQYEFRDLGKSYGPIRLPCDSELFKTSASPVPSLPAFPLLSSYDFSPFFYRAQGIRDGSRVMFNEAGLPTLGQSTYISFKYSLYISPHT